MISVFGCCRQDSIHSGLINKELAFCHNTKEMLEIIKYCKTGHISPEETVYVLRHPLVHKTPLHYNIKYKEELENTDIFIFEISSKKTYEYNNKFCHHSLYTEYKKFNINISIKNQVIERTQTFDEIYEDIIRIKNEIKKPMIIVTHLNNSNTGERYELCNMLEIICKKESIPIINPIKELVSRGIDIHKILEDGNHYNKYGHSVIKEVYDEFIKKAHI